MYDGSGCSTWALLGGIRAVRLWLCAVTCLLALPLRAQTAPATPLDSLHSMTRQAGVIFTGTVLRVQRANAGSKQAGVVEVEFAVRDAVRGVSGLRYVLREWAGGWPAADEPYRVDEQYLMLLHAPGTSGLSSPVGGDDGAILVHTAPDGTPEAVDLRWIAARTGAGPTGAPVLLPYSSMLNTLRTWEAQDHASQ